jgi:hypothetical protein
MKRLLIFALLAALFLPVVGQDETKIQLANLMRPRLSAYGLNLNQNLRTTDSPTFVGLTLSGSTASTLAYLNASKKFTSLANGAGYLLNDGSGGFSWGAVSLSGYLKDDGTVPLTADYDVGAFTITANGFTLAGNNEPLTFSNGANTHIIKQSAAEGIAGGTDLRIGLDDANQSLILCSRSNIDLDYGQVVHNAHPCLWIYYDASNYLVLTPTHAVMTGDYSWISTDICTWNFQASLAAGDAYTFRLNSGDGLTDTNGRQAWMKIAPTFKQTGTAAYDALYVDVTETAAGDGSTGDGNNLLNLSMATVSKFKVSNTGAATGLSYALSGTGTLTSAAGNVALATSLTAATGNEAALTITGTVNKLTSGNDTILKVVQTDTASPGTSYLQEWYTGTTQVGYITNAGALDLDGYATIGGTVTAGGAVAGSPSLNNGNGVYPYGANSTLNFSKGYTYYSNDNKIAFSFLETAGAAITNTGGTFTGIRFAPWYNQASGTSANTDVLIARTTTATGSGAQLFFDCQDDTVSKFNVSDKGFVTAKHPLACTHNTATPLFGITIPAGSTAGGVITYTLHVTDDDGSDDQIEVGTVQFVGLQDEANWHTNISEVSTQAVESGTLATTWAIDTATADTLKVTLLANSDLTTPVYTLSYTVTFNSAYTVAAY